jgi:hypothetical protein
MAATRCPCERRWPALGDQVCSRQICHVFFQGSRLAHFPFPPRRTARCALQPGFGPLPDIAREKIAAGGSFLGVGRSKRRNGAPRSGVRVFPRHAGVFAAPCQHFIHGSPGHQEIRLRRHLGGRPVLSQSQGAGVLRLVFFRKQIVELVRKAASGDDKAECDGARAGQIGRVRRWPRSHIRHMRQRTPARTLKILPDVRIDADRTPPTVNEW